MNIFDVIVLLIILSFGLRGFKNGVIKEGVSFLGTILVLILSFLLKGVVGNILCDLLPFFNFSGSIEGLSAMNILFYQTLGFILVFSILISIYHIIFFFSKVLQKVVNLTIILILPSKLLGLLLGLLRGYLVMFVVVLVLFIPLKDNELLVDAKYVSMIKNTPIISGYAKDVTNAFSKVFTLVKDVEDEKINSRDANLQIVEYMLEYNIVDCDEVKKLSHDKLTNIDDKKLEKVIEKYE